jgi:hypothetical protein
MVSYAGAIHRIKKEFEEEMKATNDEYKENRNEIGRSRWRATCTGMAKRLGLWAILATIGMSLAQTLAPFIHQHAEQPHSTAAPTILSGLAFAILGVLWSFTWTESNSAVVEIRREERTNAAIQQFQLQRVSQLDHHLENLMEIWRRRTKRNYRPTTTMKMAFEDDILIRDAYLMHRRQIPKNAIQMYMPVLRRIFWWQKRAELQSATDVLAAISNNGVPPLPNTLKI